MQNRAVQTNSSPNKVRENQKRIQYHKICQKLGPTKEREIPRDKQTGRLGGELESSSYVMYAWASWEVCSATECSTCSELSRVLGSQRNPIAGLPNTPFHQLLPINSYPNIGISQFIWCLPVALLLLCT